MIHWLWTHLLCPSWNERNTLVHKHYRAEKSKRQLSDTLIEVEELYQNTDRDSLGYIDRQLLEVDICELRQRPQHQLDAWIMSIEAAIRSAAISSAPPADPNQQHLSFARPPVPVQREPAPQLPKTFQLLVIRRISYQHNYA